MKNAAELYLFVISNLGIISRPVHEPFRYSTTAQLRRPLLM